jgi:hypothetical protein
MYNLLHAHPGRLLSKVAVRLGSDNMAELKGWRRRLPPESPKPADARLVRKLDWHLTLPDESSTAAAQRVEDASPDFADHYLRLRFRLLSRPGQSDLGPF